MRKLAVIAGLIAIGLGITFALLLSHHGPGTITSHGDVMVETSGLYAQDPATAFPDIADGGQVTVIDSSGKVIGTGTLTQAASDSLLGGYISSEDFTFAVTVPAGLPRYGIEVGHDRGTVWFSAKDMKSGSELSLSD